MWAMDICERLIMVSNALLPILADLLLYSTVIGGVGLLGSHLLRKRGVVCQSLFLRLSLLAILLAPLAAAFMSEYGVKGVHLPMTRVEKPDIRKNSPVDMKPVTPEYPSPVVRSLPAVTLNERPQKAEISNRHMPQAPRTGSSVSPASPVPPSSTIPNRVASSPVVSGDIPQAENRGGLLRVFQFWAYFLFPLLWVVLSLVLLLRTLIHNISIQILLSTAYPAHPSRLAVCASLADSLGIKKPRVLESPHVRRAFLAGLFRPAIVLPFGPETGSMSSREVFLHEFAHLIRRDHLWNLVCQIGKAILPLQPLMWLLARQIEVAGEYACDDFVIMHGGNNRGYARQLYALALQFRTDRGEVQAGVGIFSVKSYLFQRIDRILDSSRVRRLKIRLHEAFSFVVLFLSSVALSGLFSFRSEAAKRGGMNGAGRIQEKQSTLSSGEKLSEKRRPFQEKRDDRFARALSGSAQSSASEGDTPVQKKGIPEIADDGRDENNTGATSPNALLASLQISPDMDMKRDRLAEADDGALSADVPAEMISLTSPSTPADMPDSVNTFPRRNGEEHAGAIARDSLPPDWLELRNSGTVNSEPAAILAGVLKIEIPETAKPALRESLERGQQSPVWSPSGKIIAFTGANGIGIWVVSAAGGTPRLILDNSEDTTAKEGVSTRGAANILGFTPDGGEITYVKFVSKTAASGAKKEAAAEAVSLIPVIESINILTGVKREVVRDASDGNWSPDSRYFVYVEGDYYGISVLDTTTGSIRKVSSTGKSPCITADGSAIVYVDWGGGATDQLFSTPLTGGKPAQLTAEGFWWNPKCSPDGEWVLCSRGMVEAGSYARLQAYNFITRKVYTIMTGSGESAEVGGWSPSGKQFCYTISGGTYLNGKNMRKSSIYIENFQLTSMSGQETATDVKPSEFKLIGNYPNPFNPSTTITFTLPSEGTAELVIYNMAGQKIRTLLSGKASAGEHAVVWNGHDQQGNPVSSGVYISRLMMEGKVETRRMTLVK